MVASLWQCLWQGGGGHQEGNCDDQSQCKVGLVETWEVGVADW